MTLLATSSVSHSNAEPNEGINVETNHSYIKSVSIDEFEEFSITVKFEDIVNLPVGNVSPPATYPVSITQVSIPSSLLGVTATFSGDIVTIRGSADLNNVRSVSYISDRNQKSVATTFSTLPQSYRAIYSYKQAQTGTTTVSLTISSKNHTAYSLPFLVSSNDTRDVLTRLNKLLERGVY